MMDGRDLSLRSHMAADFTGFSKKTDPISPLVPVANQEILRDFRIEIADFKTLKVWSSLGKVSLTAHWRS